jgi:hypothetical protein
MFDCTLVGVSSIVLRWSNVAMMGVNMPINSAELNVCVPLVAHPKNMLISPKSNGHVKNENEPRGSDIMVEPTNTDADDSLKRF